MMEGILSFTGLDKVWDGMLTGSREVNGFEVRPWMVGDQRRWRFGEDERVRCTLPSAQVSVGGR